MPKRRGVNSRKKRVQRKRKFTARIKKFVPILGGCAAFLLLVAGGIYGGTIGIGKLIDTIDQSRLFTIGKIKVRGNERIAAETVLKRCGIAPDSKIYHVKTATVSAALLADPWIEKVSCITRWWGTVAIEIKERTPIALVNYGEVRLVDRSGVLLPVEPGTTYDLPMISAVRTVVDGNGNRRPDSASIARAALFIDRAAAAQRGFFRRIAQLDIRDNGRIRCLAAGRPMVIDIGYEADAKQMRNLWYLLEALEGGPPAATRIDLRYQNLAFVYQEPSGSVQRRDVNN